METTDWKKPRMDTDKVDGSDEDRGSTNDNGALHLCLNMLQIFGFLVPGSHSETMMKFIRVNRFFWFFFTVGTYIIVQVGDLVQIWGNLSLMVSTSFMLLTNCALAAKILVFVKRGDAIQQIIDEGDQDLKAEASEEGKAIIKDCHRETTRLLYVYTFLPAVTVLGLAASAEKNSLPLRAWYPYDEYKSPAYEITYAYQTAALSIAAALNIGLDMTMTTLMALCSCRLQLAALALTNLCSGLHNNQHLLRPEQEKVLRYRLQGTVVLHQRALRAVAEIQACFSEPILGQFAVSVVIICVTAYQLAVEARQTDKNLVRVLSMVGYLMCMTMQVFLYCYQGNHLSLESSEIAYAAFKCEWYGCSAEFRRALLLVMVRSRLVAKLTAGGFTTLSLATFTAIIKASYTFFTVLQQVDTIA